MSERDRLGVGPDPEKHDPPYASAAKHDGLVQEVQSLRRDVNYLLAVVAYLKEQQPTPMGGWEAVERRPQRPPPPTPPNG